MLSYFKTPQRSHSNQTFEKAQLSSMYEEVVVRGKKVAIPKGSYIFLKFKELQHRILSAKGLTLRPYYGRSLKTTLVDKNVDMYVNYPEEIIRDAVNSLPIFDLNPSDLPVMEDGRVFNTERNSFMHCYTLEEKLYNPVAAIFFEVDILNDECTIEILAVNPTHHRKGYGSILLQTAVYISSLYGCNLTILHCSLEVVSFYQSHGFELIGMNSKEAQVCGKRKQLCDKEEQELTEKNKLIIALKGGTLELSTKSTHFELFIEGFKKNFPNIDFIKEFMEHKETIKSIRQSSKNNPSPRSTT